MGTITELIDKRGYVPTSTVHQARLQIFQPTRRPEMCERFIETTWGEVRVKGKLGQTHADVIEAIMFSGEMPAEIEDGRIKLLVDPAKVRRLSRQDGTTFKVILDDLMQTIVEIKEPVTMAGRGHLIDHIRTAQGVTAHDPLHPGTQRKLWRVDLGKSLCQMIEADLWLRRDPSRIAGLRHGISQAVARHVLSHKPGACERWGMDTLIRAVAGDLSDQALRDRRREIRADAAALADLGVVIKLGMDGV